MTQTVKSTLQTIKDILTKEQTEILRAASLLMIPALLTKVTGQVFTLITATQLGTGKALNEFLFANELPQLLADILLTGAITTLVIPFFVQVKEEEGEESFLRFYNTVLNLLVAAFLVATLFIVIFANQVLPLVLDYIVRPAPGDYPDTESLGNIANMLRVLMIPQLFLGLSVLVSGGINVYHRFLLPQLAPLFYNFGRIFGVLILLPVMGESSWPLIFGVVLGSALHLGIQLPLAKMLGLRYQFVFDLKSKYLRKFAWVALPRLFAYTGSITSTALTRLIVSGFNQSFYAVMFYASSLANIVPGIFGYAFSVASFPTLSKLYNQKNFGEINGIVLQAINQIFFLATPVILVTMILRLPVVRLIYGLLPNTSFDRTSTLMVGWTLLFFSIGIIFAASKWYLYRIFYVAQNTWVPLFISIISLGLTVGMTTAFTNFFSHSDEFSVWHIPLEFGNFFYRGDGLPAVGGAALALSLAAIIEFTLLLWAIDKYVLKLDFIDLVYRLTKKLIPMTISGLVMYFMYQTWEITSLPIDAEPGFRGSTTFNLFILTSLTVGTCFMLYFLLCYLFGVEELRILKRLLNPIFRLGGLRID